MKVKRTGKKTAAKPSRVRRAGKKTGVKDVSVILPRKPSQVITDIREASWLIHGEKKIGKTSMLAEEEDSYFMEWDPPQKGLSILQTHMPDWPTFLAYLAEIEKLAQTGKCPYKTIVQDGTDVMYEISFRWKCKQLGIEHPHDEGDYGKSWGEIRWEFTSAIQRLLALPGVSCRFICHSSWQEIKTRDGSKQEKLVPLLKGQAEEVLIGRVDIWSAYCYAGNERVLVVVGDESTGAGHRFDKQFRTPDGRQIKEIPLGNSAKQAYANVLQAWNNKQRSTTLQETQKSKGGKPRINIKRGGKRKS